MIDCTAMSERMPEVARGDGHWSEAEAAHLAGCSDCRAEWQVVRAGTGLASGVMVDQDRLIEQLLPRLRGATVVKPLRRLRWRNFALGLAAAASVTLAVWVPGHQAGPAGEVVLPRRIGPLLPSFSNLSDEELDRMVVASEGGVSAQVPGALPHLDELSEADLEQLSRLSEIP